MASVELREDPARLRAALRLALDRYLRQMRARPWLSWPGLLLPGVGQVFVQYAPPLVIARLLEAFGRREHLDAGALVPYVVVFALLLLSLIHI